MNQEQAYATWEEIYGDTEVAYDYASHPIHKSDFQNASSPYGWDVERIQPYDARLQNLIPASLRTISMRGGKTSFRIGKASFEVRRGKRYGTFALYDITDRNHPLDMTPSEENQDPEFNRNRLHLIVNGKETASTSFTLKNPEQIFESVFDTDSHSFSALEKKEENLSDVQEEVKVEEKIEEENPEEASSENVTEESKPEEETPSDEENKVEESSAPEAEETPVEQETETVPFVEAQSEEKAVEETSSTEEEGTEEETSKEENNAEKTSAPEQVETTENEALEQEVEVETASRVEAETSEESVTEETQAEEENVPEESVESESETEESAPAEQAQEETTSVVETESAPVSEPSEGDKKKIEELQARVDSLEKENNEYTNKINELNVVLSSLKQQNHDLLVAKENGDNERERLMQEKNSAEEEKQKAEKKLQETLASQQENLSQILNADQALKDEVKRLQNENQNVKNEKDALNSELQDTKESNISLSSQLNDLQGKLGEAISPEKEKEYQDQIASLTKEKEELEASKKEAEDKVHSLEEEKQNSASTYDSSLQEKETKLSSLEKQLVDLANINKEKEEKLVLLSSQLEAKEKELSALILDEEAKATQNSEQEKSYAAEKVALIAERDSLKQEKDALAQEKETLTSSLAEKDQSIASYQETISTLQKEKEESEKKNQELQSLKEQLDALTKEKETLSASLTEKDKNIATYQENISALQKEKEESEKKNQELTSSLSATQQTESSKDQELQSLKEQLDSLTKEKESLEQEKQNLLTEKENQTKAYEALKADHQQLEAQSQMVADQVNTAQFEADKLQTQVNQLQQSKKEDEDKLEEYQAEKENDEKEIQDLKTALETSKQAMIVAESARDVAKDNANRTVARNQALNDQITDLNHQLNEKDVKISSLKDEYERQLKEKTGEILSLTAERDDARVLATFTAAGGDKEKVREMEKACEEEHLPIVADNVRLMLSRHPEWRQKENENILSVPDATEVDSSTIAPLSATEVIREDTTSLDKERARKEKAFSFYAEKYGDDKPIVSDFAGRYFRRIDFGRSDSRYGWDFVLFNPKEMETKENVLIANLRSLKDFRSEGQFVTNGHSFNVVNDGGKYKILASDYIADPFNYEDALNVTIANENTTSPLIYIFLKAIGVHSANPDPKGIKEFFSLIDRTVKRACPQSFIEMKTTLGQSGQNIVFLTFDGAIDGAYKEALDYAVLLNSYRRQFYKQNILNAIIVLDEVPVPFSKRHLDFDNLLRETGDVELRALRYEFNMSVVNSTLKRTIHIGPSILDKLPLNQESLVPSQIGQGQFATLYNFKGSFKVYNVVYSLDNNSESNE